MGWTIGVSLTLFTAIFILLPALAANGIGNLFGLDGFWFHVAEGALRLSIFLGYLLLIGLIPDIKRVFMYHGAEHKAIAAYENDAELTAEAAQHFSTQHVRCGTNFLLTVMVVTILVYSFVGRPGMLLLIASRVVLIPLIAGISYELIRFAAKHMEWRWVRILMRPGSRCSGSPPGSQPSTRSRLRSRPCGRCSPPSSWPRSRVAPPGRSPSGSRPWVPPDPTQ